MFKSLLPCGIFAEVNILRGNGCLLHVYGVSCYIKIASKHNFTHKKDIFLCLGTTKKCFESQMDKKNPPFMALY